MNFVLKNDKYIDEIDSHVYIYEHQKTKAQVCVIKNKDVNRAFNIIFKTLPFDDSGVFHILEHSIFCGSEKYPLKDPFIKMSQSSLASYLNAATSKSYTTFPVASTNLDDYHKTNITITCKNYGKFFFSGFDNSKNQYDTVETTEIIDPRKRTPIPKTSSESGLKAWAIILIILGGIIFISGIIIIILCCLRKNKKPVNQNQITDIVGIKNNSNIIK